MLGLFRIPSRMEDLALFTRHIAGAMSARAPLPDILRSFVSDCESGPLSRSVEALTARVEAGVELSAAMEDYPRIFPLSYRRLVRLGEQGKTLGGVMTQLADNLEDGLRTYEFFRRVAIYPLMVTVLVLLDAMIILTKIVPQFDAIFTDLGAELPGISKFVVGLSNSPLGMALFVILMLLPIAFLTAAAFGLRLRFMGYGRLALTMPLIGPIMRRAETARFANNLALLLDNHLPLDESLSLLADSSENTYVRAAIEDFHERYQKGESLGDLISSQPLFPAGMATIIASAEDRGGLVEALRGMAKYYGERTSHGLTVAREVFEPLLLLLVGLLVGMIILAIYTPMFMLPHLIPG